MLLQYGSCGAAPVFLRSSRLSPMFTKRVATQVQIFLRNSFRPTFVLESSACYPEILRSIKKRKKKGRNSSSKKKKKGRKNFKADATSCPLWTQKPFRSGSSEGEQHGISHKNKSVIKCVRFLSPVYLQLACIS